MIINSCILIRKCYESSNINNLIQQLLLFSEKVYVGDLSENDDCYNTIKRVGLVDVIYERLKFNNAFDQALNYLVNISSTGCDYIFWANGYDKLQSPLIDHISKDFICKDVNELEPFITIPYFYSGNKLEIRNEVRLIRSNTEEKFYSNAYPYFTINNDDCIEFDIFTELFDSIMIADSLNLFEKDYALERVNIFESNEDSWSKDTHLRYAQDLIVIGKKFVASNILVNIINNISIFGYHTIEERICALKELNELYLKENPYMYKSTFILAKSLYNDGIRRADLSCILGKFYICEQEIGNAFIHYQEALWLGKPSSQYSSYYTLFSHDEEPTYNLILIEQNAGKILEAYNRCRERISIMENENPYLQSFESLENDLEKQLDELTNKLE